IRGIRERILVGENASEQVMQSYRSDISDEVSDLIVKSFFEAKAINIGYQRADGLSTQRSIEVHYLFLNWPVWYLIAWDCDRQASRTFRIDRVENVSVSREVFSLKSLNVFSGELARFSSHL
ncbi:helix-turn-helix transcriptional regulator, partial [Amphritea sp.]|uniref:helix-turn-helix transcriptional regulator n=1 Tax=Amphritea sp. TaxID=1872502 RepID=UPI003D0BF559